MTVETNPEMEVDTTPPAVEEVDNDETLENEDNEQPQEEDVDNEDSNPDLEELGEDLELEEIDFEGKKYNVPREIKDSLLRQSDYTKKTQEVSELRKKVEADQADFLKARESQEADFKGYVELANLDSQLEKYERAFESPEWQEIIDSDPSRALRGEQEYKSLQRMKEGKLQEIRQKEGERTAEQQQNNAKLEAKTRETLQRDIKGWGVEMESKLSDYAKSQGFADHVMASGLKSDPIAVKTIHKAYLYDQLLKKQLSKPKVEVKPVPKVSSGKTTISKDPTRMNQDEYAKWRRERIKKRIN